MIYLINSTNKIKRQSMGITILIGAMCSWTLQLKQNFQLDYNNEQFLINCFITLVGVYTLLSISTAKIGISDGSLIYNAGFITHTIPLSQILQINIYKRGEYFTIKQNGTHRIIHYIYDNRDDFIKLLEKEEFSINYYHNK